MTFNVLVLDAKQRSALAVTRSLGRLANLRLTTADASAEALAGCSRFSSVYLSSPSSELDPVAYLRWMAETLACNHYDLVIPVTEITSQLLLMNQQQLPNLRLPFASYEKVMQLADKGELVKLAREQNVPCPESRWYASAADLDVEAESFPVVIKPCLSKIYTDSAWIATRVRVVFSKAELQEELQRSSYLHTHPFMLQEFIPGHGAGIFCLYDKGKPLAFFAHRRLREKPPEGGVSVLSESVPIDPQMQAYANKLLSAAQWHGAAMVEFRISPEGNPYLMEVNTRFWGSLQLAVDSGVDFPALLWASELADSGRGQPLAVSAHYRVGQQLRWLLGDLDSLYIYLKGDYTLVQKLQRLLQFLTPRFHNRRHEVNRWGDQGPARHELLGYLKHLSGR